MLVAAAKPDQPTIPIDLGAYFHAFKPLWPLAVIIVLLGVAKLLFEAWEARRLSRSGMPEIDRMDGPTFERRLAALFRAQGFQTEVVGGRGDYGADLVLVKGGRKTVVQAKCWRKKAVGIKAVQEAVGARGHYGADDAMVVTNSNFTPNARNLAQSNNITLWSRDILIRELLAANGSAPPAETRASIDPAPTRSGRGER